MKTNNKPDKHFHAVAFMRQARSEMTEQFLQNRQKYLDYLKQTMNNFKNLQKKVAAEKSQR